MNSKKILVVLLAVLLVLSCTALVACQGSTEPTGELQYALTEDGSSYVVVASAVGGDIVVPDSYINLPVVGIADLAFSKSSITSITIPDTITYIGDSAFWQCGSLLSVTIGNSVATIGQYAFMNCTKLNTLTLGSSITSIGQLAFFGCDNLSKVYVVGGLDSWLDIDFANVSANPMYYTDNVYLDTTATNKLCDITNVVVPSSTTAINSYAFYNCNSILSVDLAGSVVTIDDYAFDSIDTLSTVSGTDSVTYIGDYAFNLCTNLVSFDSADSLDYIGDYAFNECTNLVSFDFGNCISYLGDYSFNNCTTLSSVNIPGTLSYMGQKCFYECEALSQVTLCHGIQYISAFAFCRTGIVDITIPDSVTVLSDWSFSGCTKLQCIEMGNGVTDIGQAVFNNCIMLTDVVIGNSVQTIGASAFNSCRQLTSVTIGNGVTFLGEGAFADCNNNISTIYYNGSVADWCGIQFESSTSNPMHTGAVWYSLDSSGNYQAVSDLVIPDEVSEITQYSFYSCAQLTNVTIGNGVTAIGNYAFTYCDSLELLTLGDSVTITGNYAFTECKTLISVAVPTSLKTIGYQAFFGCMNLATVQLNQGLTNIGGGAFAWTDISAIIIPSSVVGIGEACFDKCDKLQYIDVASCNEYYCSIDGNLFSKDGTIFYQYALANTATTFTVSSEVTSVESRAFRGANYLQNIAVEEGNTTYCAVDGVLYTSDMTTLVCYPCGKAATTFVVPDGVEVIGAWALVEIKVQELYLSDTVTTLQSWALYNMNELTYIYLGSNFESSSSTVFNSCEKLSSVVISESVTQINCQTFTSCAGLTSIIFEDTDNWYITTSDSYVGGEAIDVSNPLLNAMYLTEYANSEESYYLYKVVE